MVGRASKSVIAMVPARMGSQRLPAKNLALLSGKPLIAYAIQAARAAGVFDRVVVNSEDERLARVARRYGAEFYRRPAALASAQTKSDDVVYDFLQHHPCGLLAWVNPIAPLQTGEEIRAVVEHFQVRALDSLVTVKEEQVHCVFRGRPINFSRRGRFARTQDLEPVSAFVYSVMMWRTATFLRHFRRDGHALLCGRIGYVPVSKFSAVIIKRREDLMIAEALLAARRRLQQGVVRYHRLAGVLAGASA